MSFSIVTKKLVYEELCRIRKNINYYRDVLPLLRKNLIEKSSMDIFDSSDISELEVDIKSIENNLHSYEVIEKELYQDLVKMEQ